MPKSVRFSEIVSKCGRLATATLWVEPEKDASFTKAVEQHRVMTVHHEPVGTKKDYGTIGFVKEKNANYFIFPKSLKQFEGLKVVGINYELIEEPIPKHSVASKPTSPQARPKRFPAPLKKKRFQVVGEKIIRFEIEKVIEAENKESAKTLALKEIQSEPTDPSESSTEVKVISIKNRS
jgi:hypothetical protein